MLSVDVGLQPALYVTVRIGDAESTVIETLALPADDAVQLKLDTDKAVCSSAEQRGLKRAAPVTPSSQSSAAAASEPSANAELAKPGDGAELDHGDHGIALPRTAPTALPEPAAAGAGSTGCHVAAAAAHPAEHGGTALSDVPMCPTYRPTAEQFGDPMRYTRKRAAFFFNDLWGMPMANADG